MIGLLALAWSQILLMESQIYWVMAIARVLHVPIHHYIVFFTGRRPEAVDAARGQELVAHDPRERLERRTGGAPAIRTVAVEGIFEGVNDGIAHRAAEAFSGKDASILIC